jgi:hypothetical protein
MMTLFPTGVRYDGNALEAVVGRGENVVLKRIGWVSLGVSLAAVGVYLGRELRERWVFNHQSPLDFYSHAGDDFEVTGPEYGVGV